MIYVYVDTHGCRVFTLCSYSILAPNAIPSGFVDGKVASEKILAALDMGDNYRIGHTKVFFKAGVLGQLEEMREEKLSKILSNFQARVRGYLMRGKYSKLQDQRFETSPMTLLHCIVTDFYTFSPVFYLYNTTHFGNNASPY